MPSTIPHSRLRVRAAEGADMDALARRTDADPRYALEAPILASTFDDATRAAGANLGRAISARGPRCRNSVQAEFAGPRLAPKEARAQTESANPLYLITGDHFRERVSRRSCSRLRSLVDNDVTTR